MALLGVPAICCRDCGGLSLFSPALSPLSCRVAGALSVRDTGGALATWTTKVLIFSFAALRWGGKASHLHEDGSTKSMPPTGRQVAGATCRKNSRQRSRRLPRCPGVFAKVLSPPPPASVCFLLSSGNAKLWQDKFFLLFYF